MHRFVLLLLLLSCDRIPCEDIPESFESYNEAHRIINSASFAFSDSQTTAKSSWIRRAAYHSCDGQSGFLVIRTDNGEYFHQNVPVSVWRDFKNAESYGRLWHVNIKGRYDLRLN